MYIKTIALTGFALLHLLTGIPIKTPTATMKNKILQPADSVVLSKLNAQFIKNFVTQDVTAHSKIIHQNFICIESSGVIIDRKTYLKNWPPILTIAVIIVLSTAMS